MKPAAKKKAAAAAPLGVSNANAQPKAAAGGKAIEEIYQKKSQLEHILLRPDTYIGSTEKQQLQLWVHDGSRMVQQNVSFVPGLYKIFDEILVNAADNKVRDNTMDTLKVQIDVVSSMGPPCHSAQRSMRNALYDRWRSKQSEDCEHGGATVHGTVLCVPACGLMHMTV